MNLAEGVQIVSFGLLGLMMIGAALGVVLFPSIVHSAFLLAGVFISISGLYILLNASFVAAAQILIYVGAVNVLILFAIMLVNKREDFRPLPNAWVRKGLTAFICLGLLALLGTMILSTPWAISSVAGVGDQAIIVIGEHFFTDYLLPFELASVLLLMALIGAIVLARREYLPPAITTQYEQQQPVFTLPERPRDAALPGTVRSAQSGSEAPITPLRSDR
ncbi:MAG: NADH-quinone oxidoreductase subunit J [Leptolyngbyaceae cyanobacterium bins.59]|nr:NADH-quinone oxidoreductase subunit J [Leptolyngbyaceae cyanobacterium bins.59]